jgi:flagellin
MIMGLRIQNNVEAFNAHRQLTGTASKAAKAMEKLSSGYRINRAADDAAGLAISEKMRSQIGGLAQAQRNAQDGVSLVQTAEGALNEVHSMLQRVRDLKVQYQNDTLDSSDKDAIVSEVSQLAKEIYEIADKTEFNGNKLFTQSTGFTFQVGANDNESITTTAVQLVGKAATASAAAVASSAATASTAAVASTAGTPSSAGADGIDGTGDDVAAVASTAGTPSAAGTPSSAGTASAAATTASGVFDVLDVAYSVTVDGTSGEVTGTTARTAAESKTQFEALDLAEIDAAIGNVSDYRAEFGAVQNRMEHRLANLATYQENLVASESRIRDVDMAAEMVNFTKLNILQQAGTSMLAQANQAPQGVLSLLQ